ncbi:MAG TPA: hypothetical protein PKD64_01580 [Pirellulaceae bacterium]|nr:hypothetical protein [Pirellulaceae bacterium]HMO90860.1 hypothetical protein [Pirellulaceae bacterium]HMP68664.1 hypothetical protein [Pirellulaceae bacterium]
MNDEKRNTPVSDTSTKVMLNAAFLSEIKEDNVQFKLLIASTADALRVDAVIRPRMFAELLSNLRDAIETYFALEEFYGYIEHSKAVNPQVSTRAQKLRDQHQTLYLELNGLIEETERLVYHEVPHGRSMPELIAGFFNFYEAFQSHEEEEMELVMRLSNEEIGVGD